MPATSHHVSKGGNLISFDESIHHLPSALPSQVTFPCHELPTPPPHLQRVACRNTPSIHPSLPSSSRASRPKPPQAVERREREPSKRGGGARTRKRSQANSTFGTKRARPRFIVVTQHHTAKPSFGQAALFSILKPQNRKRNFASPGFKKQTIFYISRNSEV